MMDKSKMISIIIPVYNVVDYLDRCMKSVVEQTYTNIEIILINDGSIDGSDKKCEEWSKKDARISYYSKENEGLGPTRNFGIKKAAGTYLFFVDSDDWISRNAMELLIDKAQRTDADIVFCDRYLVKRNSDGTVAEQIFRLPIYIKEVTNAVEMPQIVYHSDTATWDKLYKKALWDECGLQQPRHPYEDTPVIPVLIAKAKRVAQVRECLYYYDQNRPGNITGNAQNIRYIKTSIEELEKNARKCNVFDQHRSAFQQYAAFMAKSIIFHGKQTGSLADIAEETYQQLSEYMNCTYPGWNHWFQKNYMIWGSYNLRSTILKLCLDSNQIQKHYSFSSILSFQKEPLKKHLVCHTNPYREKMVDQDLNQSFLQLKPSDVQETAFFFVDFLEERFDVGWADGQYLTLSDAFAESETDLKQNVTVEQRDVINWKMWTDCCDSFISKLKELFLETQIVLVKTGLSYEYGDDENRMAYANQEWIERRNRQIHEYEEYFCQKLPGIWVMNQGNEEYYTDSSFPYGCVPWHLNERIYTMMADCIMEEITG